MTTVTSLASISISTLLGVCLLVGPAQAQSVRAYVSGSVGDDNNNCFRLTPCRSFQGAHNKVLAGGEILVLDQGNFATLIITKSISIVNEGVGQAGMLVGGGDTGLTVNAPTTCAA